MLARLACGWFSAWQRALVEVTGAQTISQGTTCPRTQDWILRNSVSLSGSASGFLGDLGQVALSFCASVSPVCKMVIIVSPLPHPKKGPNPFE